MSNIDTIVLREFGTNLPPVPLGRFLDNCVDPGDSWNGSGVTSATNLLLVFGDRIYYRMPTNVRIIQMPSLCDQRWNSQTFATAARFIREGTLDLELYFDSGRLVARNLIPF